MATDSIGTAKTHADPAAWEVATDNDLVTAAEGEIGEIQTNEDFDAAHVMAGATVNATFNRELTVASANRHAGIEGTGHARIYRTGTGHAIEINEDFFQVKFLDINLLSGQSGSEECIRVASGVDPVLISKCILHQDSAVNNCEGISTAVGNVRVFVDNCIIYFFRRYGIHGDCSTSVVTQTWFVDFCTVMGCNRQGVNFNGGVRATVTNSSAVIDFDAFNTISQDAGSAAPRSFVAEGAGTVNWDGSDNIGDTAGVEDKFTDSFDSVTLVDADDSDPSSGENVSVIQKDNPSEDYTINLENAFTVTQEGLDRIGSEPANSVWTTGINPQDFSKDIAGRTRPGTDTTIGAYQFSQAAVPTIASIIPAEGSESGGTSVVLTGTNYEAVQGTGGVTVGGVAATIDAWGDTEITITTPAGTVGDVDVVVTNDAGGVGTATDGYEYTVDPPAAPGDNNAFESMGFQTGFSIGAK